MIITSPAGQPRSMSLGNRAAGHSHPRLAVGTMVALLLLACSPAGCRPKSETTGGRYTHHGLGFSVTVPAGWSLVELEGDLVVRLEGPPTESGLRPVAHVFCRDEWAAVDLLATAEDVAGLLKLEASVPGAGPLQVPADGTSEERQVSDQPATVSGLPARRIVRSVTSRTPPLKADMLIVARDRRVWALVLSRAESADEPTLAAAEELRKSFQVW